MDNDRLGIVITAVCLLFLMFVVPMSGLLNNGYVVTPATDADVANSTPLETVQVSFWDLPPRIMILSVVWSICPFLLSPIEMLLFIKGFAFLGYRKITAGTVLTGGNRLRIYDTIKTNPGIQFSELSRETGINRGTLRYHLAILRMTGKISELSTGSDIRYFENSGKFSETEQKVLKSLRNETERTILERLIDNPATTRGDLEKILGISGSSVTWHTNRLRDTGMLTVSRIGKTTRYALVPEAREYVEKYLTMLPENPDNPSNAGSVA